MPCAYHVLDLKFSQILRGGMSPWSQKFHPTFKICSDTRQAHKLLKESLLNEGSKSRFRPLVFRDFTDTLFKFKITPFVCLDWLWVMVSDFIIIIIIIIFPSMYVLTTSVWVR